MTVESADKLQCILEAALLAASQPLSLAQMGSLFDEDTPPSSAQLTAALEKLQTDCQGRGVELVQVASGYRYQVRGDYNPWVSRLWADRQARYSRALLETLALIAYRQPTTRGEIEQVRGVSVSTNIIRSMEEREWIRVVGYRDVPGKPALYGTTKGFLDYFGLKSLDELPTLAELRDLENFNPELEFDGDANQAIAAQLEQPDTATPEAPATANEADDASNDASDGHAPADDPPPAATPDANHNPIESTPEQPGDEPDEIDQEERA